MPNPLSNLSKRDLVSILEIIELARNSAGKTHIRELILRTKDLIEADYAVCGLAKMPPEGPSDIVAVINGNYPEEWLEAYLKEECYRFDPLVKFHSIFSLPEFWSRIFKTPADNRVKSFIERAWDFGLRHGLSSGLYIPGGGYLSLFSFGGKEDVYGVHHKRILDILILHLNSAILKAVPALKTGGEEREDIRIMH